MKSLYILVVITVFSISLNKADDLQVGNNVGSTVAYLENVQLSAIPFTTRVKNVFYSNDRNQSIKAVTAKDLKNTQAKPTITAGGVGSSFVNVRIKSERGDALNYQVIIYV